MSDHSWTGEHIAAYVADGLTAAEAERLEAHTRTCPECATALASARELDRGLGTLFAAARPSPALEDRAIWALRAGRPRRQLLPGWARRVAVAASVLIVLGACGAGAGVLVSGGRLPVPGNLGRYTEAGDSRKAVADRVLATTVEKDLKNEDSGLESKLAAAGPGLNRIDKTVDDFVTDDPVRVPDAKSGDAAARKEAARPAQSPPAQNPVPPSAGLPNFYLAATPPGMTPFASYNGNWFGEISGRPPSEMTWGVPRSAVIEGYTVTQDQVKLNQLGSAGQVIPPLVFFRPGDARPAFAAPPTAATPTSLASADPKAGTPAPVKESGPATTSGGQPAGTQPAPSPEPARRVVIRSGDIEFEVESFDAAVATVTKLATGIKGAFVATVNSEKLPNGKMKGSITVRTPPEHLDGLVLDLRKELGKGGELKGVRIGSQDITKQYTDLESRLRAARTMEQRLLQIIKEGKGEIKQLLEAEKELGVWRTRIEEVEGELRYYSNLVALSTLTVSLAEKEIRAAAGIAESERVQAGVEVEDVEKAYQQLQAAVAEAKGRVSKAEVKQLAAGQFNATLHFEVAPEAAGPLRDRLRQLGRVARLEIDRVQQPQAGAVVRDARVHRGDTVFLVQLYNLAGVAPRETAVLQVAVPDVSAAYQTLRTVIAKAAGRVVTAQLNEQDRQNITAQLDFEVPRADEGAIRAALDAAGEVVARQVTRAPEGENVTDTKVLYRATLLAAGKLKPRETTTLSVEVADVDQAAAVVGAQVAELKGRPVENHFTREPSGRITAKVVYEVPLAAAAGLVERVKAVGTVRAQQSTRDPNAAEGKFATARLDVTLTNAEGIVSADDGLWPPVRRGLSYSASVLLTSVTWVVFGLCVVLPWVLVGYAGYRAVRWATRSGPAPRPESPAPPAA